VSGVGLERINSGRLHFDVHAQQAGALFFEQANLSGRQIGNDRQGQGAALLIMPLKLV